MATWRDQLRPASFRGVPFFWKDLSTEVGRKTARHDYPGLDEAYIEDLGQVPRQFSIEAFVLGADYMAKRDDLIIALETPGPGELVHPTYGKILVTLDGTARVSESTREGGMAQFSLYFVVAGLPILPGVSVDTGVAVTAVADQLTASNVLTGAAVAPRLGIATQFVSRCMAITAEVESAQEAIAAFSRDLDTMQQSLNTLVAAPAALYATIVSLVNNVAFLVADPLPALSLYDELLTLGNNDVAWPRATAAERDLAASRDSAAAQVQLLAIAASVRVATEIDFASYQDAILVRDRLVAHLDRMLALPIIGLVNDDGPVYPAAGEYALSDDVWALLADLRVALIRDIDSRGANLARIVTWTPAVTLPALVIAQRLYGDATRAEEIVSRNHLPHPGFVLGGRPLEVLSVD